VTLHKRPGQRLTIAKDGERNGPLSTTRSDDDDDVKHYGSQHRLLKVLGKGATPTRVPVGPRVDSEC